MHPITFFLSAMYRFKVSKYKNAAPKIPKKEQWITEIPLDHVMHSCGNFIKVSGKHIAFNVESGSGGCAGILPLNATGRRNKKVPTIYAHPEFLTDMDFSPFDDDLLATCSYDGYIKLWSVPENFEDTLDTPIAQLTPNASSKRVESVLFHPCADDVLASIVHDTVEIFDLHKGESMLSCASSNGDNFQSISWKLDGSQIISSNKVSENNCKHQELVWYYVFFYHSVISPQNFWEKSGFSKGFCLRRSHFSKCLGRKGFGKEFEFSDFCLGGESDF